MSLADPSSVWLSIVNVCLWGLEFGGIGRQPCSGVHPPVPRGCIYDAGWRDARLKKKSQWNFWPLILWVCYSLFIVVWPAVMYLYIKSGLLANLCFRTKEWAINLLTGKCPLSSLLRWPWGFQEAACCTTGSWESREWSHYPRNLSQNLLEIFWENFVLWGLVDNSPWNCPPWHAELFMSVAVGILGVIEELRVSGWAKGSYATACSPLVQRKVCLSPTISNKDIVSVSWSPVALGLHYWNQVSPAFLWRINLARLHRNPQLQAGYIRFQKHASCKLRIYP